MSRSIDERIVSLMFDNKEFEKNAKQSIETLASLDKALDFKNAAKGLSGLENAASGIDLSALYEAANTITDRFSTMGIVTATIVSRVTNAVLDSISNITNKIVNLTYTGGLSRAMNIQQAKFQLEGLGVTWDKVADSISFAVDGTAYGLDAAAKVASQLVASSVELGDEMSISLRAISGVAAMTNSSYEDIGHIFTTIAGNGRLMGDQLNQLSFRGLNAAATIAKALGKTEKEVREMTSDGEISFKMFAQAMYDAFGEHATAANKTLTGVLSNTKAALSRIGAEFIQPIIANEGPLVSFMENVRLRINALKTLLTGTGHASQIVTDEIITFLNNFSRSIESFEFFELTAEDFANIATIFINSIKAIINWTGPLKRAFMDVFGEYIRNAYYNLSSFIEGLKNLSYRMLYSSEVGTKVRNIFTGFFSIFDMGYKTLRAFAYPVEMIIGVLKNLASYLLDSGSSLGRWLYELDYQLTNWSGGFDQLESAVRYATDKIADCIRSLEPYYQALMKVAAGAIDYIIGKYDLLKNTILTLLQSPEFRDNFLVIFLEDTASTLANIELDTSKFEKFFTMMLEAVSPMDAFSKGIKYVADTISNIWNNVLPVVTIGGKKIKELITEVGKVMLDTFASNGSLAKALEATTLGVLFYNMKNFAFSIRDVIKTFKTPFDNLKTINDTIDKLRTSLIEFEKNLQASYFLEIGIAMLMMAAAMKTISEIQADRFTDTLTAFTLAMGELFGVVRGFSMKFDPTGAVKLAVLLIALSAAVYVLATALKKMSNMTSDELSSGLTGMTIILFEIAAVAKALSHTKSDIVTGAGTLVIFAIACSVMAGALKRIGALTFGETLTGLLGLVAIVTMLKDFMLEVIDLDPGKLTLVGLGVIGIAAGVTLLSIAAAALGKLDLDQIGKGLGAVLAILLLVTAMAKTTKGSEAGLLAVAASLLVLSAACAILAPSLLALSLISSEGLIKALSGIMILLAQVAMTADLMDTSSAAMIVVAGAFVVFAAGVAVLTPALLALGNISLEGVIKSVGSIMLILAQLGLMSSVMSIGDVANLLLLSSALVVFGAAVALLTPSLVALSLIPLEGILMSFVALAGTFAILGLAAITLSPIIPLIFSLATAMMAVGAAVALFGAGLSLAASALAAVSINIAANAVALVTAITTLVTGFLTLVPTIITAFVNALQLLLEALIKFAPTLANGIVTIIISAINVVTESIPQIVEAVLKMLNAVLKAIIDYGPQIMESGKTLLSMLISGLVSLGGYLLTTIGGMMKNLVSQIITNRASFTNVGKDLILWLVTGIASVASKLASGVKEAVTNGYTAVKNKISDFKEVGKDIIRGIIDGIKSKAGDLYDSLKNAAKKAVEAAKEKLKIHSPSRVFKDEVGKNVMLGFIAGVADNAHLLYDSMGDVGETLVDVAGKTADAVTGVMDEIDANPTITPVLDTSLLSNGASLIGSMFSNPTLSAGFGGITGNGVTDLAAMIGSALETNARNIANLIDTLTLNSDNNVTVNVQLQGDSAQIFRVVRTENEKFIKSTGVNPLALNGGKF